MNYRNNYSGYTLCNCSEYSVGIGRVTIPDERLVAEYPHAAVQSRDRSSRRRPRR